MERALLGVTLPGVSNMTIESMAAATIQRPTATVRTNQNGPWLEERQNASTATVREVSASASTSASTSASAAASAHRRALRLQRPERLQRPDRAAELALDAAVAAKVTRADDGATAYFAALSEVTSSRAANGFNLSQVHRAGNIHMSVNFDANSMILSPNLNRGCQTHYSINPKKKLLIY